MKKFIETAETSRPADARLFVMSVAKAFRVLETFAEPNAELSLTEISDRSGIGRSAAQRILYTLTSIGYLVQDQQHRQYRLSPKLFALTRSYAKTDLLRAEASDILKDANRRCEETINLTILDGTEVVYVLRFPSKHVVSVNLTVGTRLPAFCTAPGRALLAHVSEEKADAILSSSDLEKRTEMTEIRIERLRRILRQVRRDGYAISNQEAFVGDISVAAPVFDESGDAVAAVNIAVPYPRWAVEQAKAKLKPLVVETAAQVTQALGGRSGQTRGGRQ